MRCMLESSQQVKQTLDVDGTDAAQKLAIRCCEVSCIVGNKLAGHRRIRQAPHQAGAGLASIL